jgi:protein gp37
VRISHLQGTNAGLRFLSIELLIGPLDELDLRGIAWVIVGGESGRKRRLCEVEWIVNLVRQCRDASVPCLVKQDRALRPEQQGRLPDEIWAVKEFPQR